MKCHLCKENKLSKEFPFHPLSKDCRHPLLHCLDCVTASVKQNQKCSQCEAYVAEDNKIYQEYLETLDFLFPPEEADDDHDVLHASASLATSSSGEISVTTMSGESVTLSYDPTTTISRIKMEVEKELKIPCEKQRLLYEKKELKIKDEGRERLTLKHYNIEPGSTLHLIIVLCAVPENLDHAIFDFYWRLPTEKTKDYLDVSVFVYSGREYLGYINFRHPEREFCPGVIHSGRAGMNYRKREGHQQVDVLLKSVPEHIDKLVFTLSAWGSSSIAAFPYSRLNFYDENYPDKQLCSDEMSHANHCKAIIFCCLTKIDGIWEALRLGIGAYGYTKNYGPLKKKISELIRRGFLNKNN